jgi:hypothetical protein
MSENTIIINMQVLGACNVSTVSSASMPDVTAEQIAQFGLAWS